MKILSLCLLITLLCGAHIALAALPEAMVRTYTANDYAAFVEEADKVPAGDMVLAEALEYAAAGLEAWHPMCDISENPMTRIRMMEYLLARGTGKIMMPPQQSRKDDTHYDIPVPVSMHILHTMIESANTYPALLIAAHCDIRKYVNIPLAPRGETLLYEAVMLGRMDMAHLLMKCGADETINPVGKPSFEEMLNTRPKQVRQAWKQLLAETLRRREENKKYDTRPLRPY